MEIRITSSQVLKALQIISWIIFIGLCIEAGGILFNSILTLASNPVVAGHFWGIDLSGVFNFSRTHFISITTVMFIIATLKAILFYLIVKLFVKKQLDMSKPFSKELRQFMVHMAWLALGIALFSHSGGRFRTWLMEQRVQMPDLSSLRFAGADIWLFMAVILMVFAQILKRGIEIQTENELTV
ncbi:MAG: DUF2975 domain-containing protein [Chitinophagaceae bacterium]